MAKLQGAWRRMLGAGPIQSVICQGYRIRFVKEPPLSRPRESKETKLTKDKMTVVRSEVKDLVRKKAGWKVPWQEAMRNPGYYSKMFCVLKSDGGQRPIINLRPMNCFVQKERFKMETIQNVKELWGATIDLRDAFYHMNIHKKSRKFLRFILDRQVYKFTGLPMGLTCSPSVHQPQQDGGGHLSQAQGHLCLLHRQHPGDGRDGGGMQKQGYVCPAVTLGPGIPNKFREVCPPAQQEVPIPGHVVGHGRLDSQPLREERGSTEKFVSQTESQRLLNLQTGGRHDREGAECNPRSPAGQGPHHRWLIVYFWCLILF